MQELKDAYADPRDISDDGPISELVPPSRRAETDFYSKWAPDFKTGKQVMQEIEKKHGGELSERVKRLTVTSAGPPLSAAQALYLRNILNARGCTGPYVVHNVQKFGPFTSYNFKNDVGSPCPLCKVDHAGYTFSYKVKEGSYGGWKCWKNDEWETQYLFGEYEVLY